MFVSKKKLSEIELRLGRIEQWINTLESVLVQAETNGDEVELVFEADKEMNASIRGKKLN